MVHCSGRSALTAGRGSSTTTPQFRRHGFQTRTKESAPAPSLPQRPFAPDCRHRVHDRVQARRRAVEIAPAPNAACKAMIQCARLAFGFAGLMIQMKPGIAEAAPIRRHRPPRHRGARAAVLSDELQPPKPKPRKVTHRSPHGGKPVMKTTRRADLRLKELIKGPLRDRRRDRPRLRTRHRRMAPATLRLATASRFADVMATRQTGESADRRNYPRSLCASDLPESRRTYSNRAMLVGTEREPDARALYRSAAG